MLRISVVFLFRQSSQTPGQKNFPFTYYYNPNRAKWPGTEPGNKKSSKSFSDLLLSLAAPVAVGSLVRISRSAVQRHRTKALNELQKRLEDERRKPK